MVIIKSFPGQIRFPSLGTSTQDESFAWRHVLKVPFSPIPLIDLLAVAVFWSLHRPRAVQLLQAQAQEGDYSACLTAYVPCLWLLGGPMLLHRQPLPALSTSTSFAAARPLRWSRQQEQLVQMGSSPCSG